MRIYKKTNQLLVLMLTILLSPTLFAHPVTWGGGWVSTTQLTPSKKHIQVHHSLTHQWSMGMHAVQFTNQTYGMLQINRLINRCNGEGSQGNIYVLTGAGTSGQSDPIGHIGLQTDWETRRIYTYLRIDYFSKSNPFTQMNVRLGMAPYLANYTEINTWVILQATQESTPYASETYIIPMVRLFKQNVLLEIGSDFSDRYLFTAMIHF